MSSFDGTTLLNRAFKIGANIGYYQSRLIPALLVSAAILPLTTNTFGQSLAGGSSSSPTPTQIEQEGLRRQEERTKQQQQQWLPKSDVLQRPTPTAMLTDLPDESPCFVITEVVITGPNAKRFGWLQNTTRPLLNRCTGVEGLRRIASALDAKLIEFGYATTRVSLPKQNLQDGKLTLFLHVGQVAEMRMLKAGEPGPKPDDTWGTWRNAFPVGQGDILNVRDLEQGVEQMKRLTSQSVATRIEPGQDPDTSVVLIERQATTFPDRTHGGLTLDNSGSAALGRTQLSSYFTVDNLLGLNDILTLGGNINLEQPNAEHRSQGLSASYNIPWGYHTFSLSHSSSQFAQIVQGTTARFLSSGSSKTTEAKWHYLVFRSASAKAGIYASVSTRRANSFLDDVELIVQRRQTTNLETGITFRQLLGQGSAEFELGYRQGMPWQDAQADFPTAADGGLTIRPRILSLTASVNQPIQIAGRSFQYTATLHAQSTADKTLSVDQISIGSRSSVRGFDGDSVLLAESGFFLRNELSTFVPMIDGVDASAFMGLDLGRVWGPSAESLVGTKLAGLAAGVRAKWKAVQFDFTLATPLYQPEGFQSRRWNPYVSVTYAF